MDKPTRIPASFWDNHYSSNHTPWQIETPQQALTQYIESISSSKKILVPGCGTCPELKYLSETRHDITGLDISALAVQKAGEEIKEANLLVGDFFEHPFENNSFDIIYERTFFCALHPTQRHHYAQRMKDLLKPGGKLVGYFFIHQKETGPPFGITEQDFIEIIKPYFTIEEKVLARDSIEFFQGKEYWYILNTLHLPL